MDTFRFAPELFEIRNDVMAMLSEQGFDWLSHYGAVDPVHDAYGIEVCGIVNEEDAVQILTILNRMYPNWNRGHLERKDYGREPGWKVKVVRDSETSDDSWRRVG